MTAVAGGGIHRRSSRRWRLLRIGGLLAAVLLVGGYWLAQRNRARPVSIDEARDRLPSSTTAPPVDDARPRAGVYEYAGSGTDRLSLPPLHQDQGPTIPGTVELLAGGCWRFRVDYSTNHWQSYEYCRTPLGLEERGAQTFQRWMIGATPLDNTTRSDCDDGTPFLPTEREVGQTWDARCVITNDTISGETVSAGPYRFVGEERVLVGGEPIATLHFERVRVYSGGQEGTEVVDVWLHAGSGLPVRNQRTTDVETDTPVGASRYTETGEYRLQSLTPAG